MSSAFISAKSCAVMYSGLCFSRRGALRFSTCFLAWWILSAAHLARSGSNWQMNGTILAGWSQTLRAAKVARCKKLKGMSPMVISAALYHDVRSSSCIPDGAHSIRHGVNSSMASSSVGGRYLASASRKIASAACNFGQGSVGCAFGDSHAALLIS